MSYVKSCCDAVPQGKLYYRQARSLATGNLVNEWFPVDRIPAGPADFKFYSYLSNQCLKISYSDAVGDTPGVVGTRWDAINSDEEQILVCNGGDAPSSVYVPFRSDDGSGGDYRDLAFSLNGPIAVGGVTGTVVTATAVGTVAFNYICDRPTAACRHRLQVFRVRAGVPAAVSGVFSDTRDGGGGSVSFSVQTGDVIRVQITAASGGCASRYHDEAGVSDAGGDCPDAPPAPVCVLTADLTALKASASQWSQLDDTATLTYDAASGNWAGPGRASVPSQYTVRVVNVPIGAYGSYELHVASPGTGHAVQWSSGGSSGTFTTPVNEAGAGTASSGMPATVDVTALDVEKCNVILYVYTAGCDGTTKTVTRQPAIGRRRAELVPPFDEWQTYGTPTYYRLGAIIPESALGTTFDYTAAGPDPLPPGDEVYTCEGEEG